MELDANALAQRETVLARVQPQHAQAARVRLAQTLDALDGGGLAGAVRTQHTEDLAAADVERNPVHRAHAGVLLYQALNLNDPVLIGFHLLTPWLQTGQPTRACAG